MNGFLNLKGGAVKDEREAIAHETPASIFKDYQISRGLIEEYISGYKTLAYSHRYIKNVNLGDTDSPPLGLSIVLSESMIKNPILFDCGDS